MRHVVVTKGCAIYVYAIVAVALLCIPNEFLRLSVHVCIMRRRKIGFDEQITMMIIGNASSASETPSESSLTYDQHLRTPTTLPCDERDKIQTAAPSASSCIASRIIRKKEKKNWSEQDGRTWISKTGYICSLYPPNDERYCSLPRDGSNEMLESIDRFNAPTNTVGEYTNIRKKLPATIVKKGVVDNGLFINEDVKAGRRLQEYTGNRVKGKYKEWLNTILVVVVVQLVL